MTQRVYGVVSLFLLLLLGVRAGEGAERARFACWFPSFGRRQGPGSAARPFLSLR